MSHDELSQIKNLIRDLDDKMVQQRSSHHSDILKQMLDLKKQVSDGLEKVDARIDVLEKELGSWKLASKIGVAVLVAIGAIVTWVINTLGVKIGLR